MRYRYRGTTAEAFSRDVATVEPGEAFVQLKLSGPMLVHTIFVQPDYVHEVVEGDHGSTSVHLRGAFDSTGTVFPLLERARRLLADPGADSLDVEHAVRQVVRSAFTSCGERLPRPIVAGCARAVQNAVDLIQETYSDPLTLLSIASEVGVSRWYLERTFSKVVGVPVHRYVQLVRVTRALQLLARGHLAIDVAAAVGFADQAHMNSVFQQRLGITPGAYRRRA